MITYKRICLKDLEIQDELVLVRGKEYITSETRADQVVVFSNNWFSCPVEYFGGEIKFT